MKSANPRRTDSAIERFHWLDANYDGSPGKGFAAKPSGTPDVVDLGFLQESYLRLKEENTNLKRENKMLREEIEASRNQADPPGDIHLRDIPHEQAKKEIADFFSERQGKVIYTSDVAAELNLSYLLVEEVIGELEDEGEITRSV
jgi:hypothetical protein